MHENDWIISDVVCFFSPYVFFSFLFIVLYFVYFLSSFVTFNNVVFQRNVKGN